MVPRFTLHVLASFMSNGILNLECAVRPLGSRRDATPDDATASTIFFSERKLAIKVVHRNVLPVPPWPQTKKKPGDLL
uniref:Uncharacterized protein n=1 Tax=Zea mays TaxID=4577 RepID=B4FZT9_MAIZE|nr:unknown [Zea mays]